MRYLLLRFAWFFPTLFGVSLLILLLSAEAPLNPLEKKCEGENTPIGEVRGYRDCLENQYHQYGFDRPVFYLGLRTLAEPPHFAHVADPKERRARQALTHHFGNGEAVAAFFFHLEQFLDTVQTWQRQAPDSQRQAAGRALLYTQQLFHQAQPEQLTALLHANALFLEANPALQPLREPLDTLQKAFHQLEAMATPWKAFVPWLAWHGFNCRYHLWLGDFVQGKWGKPLVKPEQGTVFEKIRRGIGYSLFFSLLPVLLVFLLALPLGVWAARQQGQVGDRLSGLLLFSLDAVPNFWMALLLMYFFANPDFLKWFPATFQKSHGDSYPPGTYVLPLIAYTYGGLAYLSRLTRANLLEVMQAPFLRTAQAKGLPPWRIYWLHGLRSAALPLVTILAGLFPALIGGSVILEKIFNIPGIGQLILQAAQDNDLPVVMAVFSLMALLTALGYLAADLLYAWIDPRIRLGAR